MEFLRQRQIARWLLLALAVLPAGLYAWQGSFTRLHGDDYANLARGDILGMWESVLWLRNNWSTSYSDAFIHGLLGPVSVVAPPVFVAFTVVSWVLALAWLMAFVLAAMGLQRRRKTLATGLASLVVAASIAGFYAREAFHWYTACLEYTFPLALQTAIIALTLVLARRTQTPVAWAGAAVASALVCFVCAGLSEMYVIFQVALMSLSFGACLLAIQTVGRRIAFLLGAGWLGTLASLALQWTAPGRLVRTERLHEYPQFRPVRDLGALFELGLRDLYDMATEPQVLAGALMLFALGLLLSIYGRPLSPPRVFAGVFMRMPKRMIYLAAGIVQLALLPGVWTHSSDEALILSRFSLSFLPVVILNLVLILCFMAAAWRYPAWQSALSRDSRWARAFVRLVCVLALGLLILPGLRAINLTAQHVVILSALCLLAVAWREWTEGKGDEAQVELSAAAIVCTAIGLLSVAALITVPRMFVGVGDPRHWPAAAYVFVALGLIWGVAFGQNARQLSRPWRTSLTGACVLAVVIVYTSIVTSQLNDLPNFMTYAREWDERHELLLAISEAGERDAVIPPRTFDLERFLTSGEMVADTGNLGGQAVLKFYDLDSIKVDGAS